LSLGAVCLALGARAQEPPPAVAPEPNAPLVEPAIPAPEIATRAEDAKTLLRDIAERTAPSPTEAEIEAKLPEISPKLRERAQAADAALGAAPSVETLVDLGSEWGSRSERLTLWRHALTRSALSAESELARLAEERERWERTKTSPDARALPGATLARIDETVDALRNGERELRRRRSHLLTLQNEVAQQELIVSDISERIARLRTDSSALLFRRDAPALWDRESFVPTNDTSTFLERLQAAYQQKRDVLREYFVNDAGDLQVKLALFLIVFLALVFGRPRAAPEDEEEDPALAAARRVFARPVSAALVVAVVVCALTQPRRPTALADLEGIALIVPVLRILPRELFGELRPALLSVAALWAAGSIRSLLESAAVLARFLILFESAAAALLLLWVLRPDRLAHLKRVGRYGALVPPLARVSLVALFAGLCANAVGYSTASGFILRVVLVSAYSSIVIYGLTRIAAGAVTALVRGPTARRLRSVYNHGEVVRSRTLSLLYVGGLLLWATAVLRITGLSGQVAAGLARALGAKLEVGAVAISLGNVVAFGVTLWIAYVLSRILRFLLDEDVLPHIALPRGVPAAISTGTHYAVLFTGFVLALGAAGIDLSKFGLIAGALGVGLGFGLQNVVSNFVSGLILLFERPVQTGDLIEVGPLIGEVKRIGIRSSTVRTTEGADVIVPNASLISERVVNWTFTDRQRRLDFELGVAYGTDPEKVIAILLEAAKTQPEVLSLPEPAAYFVAFGESSLDFKLEVWCRFELLARVRSELGLSLSRALRDAGIDIPFPQRDVHLKTEPE
jgi:small-conductance mechanosensitive channel